jgi:hypothetical protein
MHPVVYLTALVLHDTTILVLIDNSSVSSRAAPPQPDGAREAAGAAGFLHIVLLLRLKRYI